MIIAFHWYASSHLSQVTRWSSDGGCWQCDDSKDSSRNEQDKNSLKHEQNELAKIENESSGDEKKSEDATTSTVQQRAHFVTIQVEDYNRLDPGEWLNNLMVYFWMQ
jgi:Ulp1 family protease